MIEQSAGDCRVELMGWCITRGSRELAEIRKKLGGRALLRPLSSQGDCPYAQGCTLRLMKALKFVVVADAKHDEYTKTNELYTLNE